MLAILSVLDLVRLPRPERPDEQPHEEQRPGAITIKPFGLYQPPSVTSFNTE